MHRCWFPDCACANVMQGQPYLTGNQYRSDAGICSDQNAVSAIEAKDLAMEYCHYFAVRTIRRCAVRSVFAQQDGTQWNCPKYNGFHPYPYRVRRRRIDNARCPMAASRTGRPLTASPQHVLPCHLVLNMTYTAYYVRPILSTTGGIRHSPSRWARQMDAQDTRSACIEHSTQHHTVRRLSGFRYHERVSTTP